MIRLKDVCKTYQMGEVNVMAVCNANLDIYPGEFLVIEGPSGSGKSTMMNMVGCLDIPTEGHIFLNGDDISEMDESDLAQIRGQTIGFIFQNFNLIATLTALENVMLPMTFQDVPHEERIVKAREVLELVGLGDRIGHKPTELSGGQQQRVAIARSLVNDPDVILADEPTGNLDSKTGINVMEFMKKLNREKHKTIIMVTHDQNLAKYADRVVYLKDGAIVKDTKNNHAHSSNPTSRRGESHA
ncbi:ABC transporter ATP-binding protein [Candidatus Woesearchaeota archaeon]|nr:ABC transporter ATP-binding protein [Candidatus Woesearchaeota archaeon]